MRVSAQVSLYPLRQEKLGPAIEVLRGVFERQGIDSQVGAMSTLIAGEARQIFQALEDGFALVAERGAVAMVVTVSNACPATRRGTRPRAELAPLGPRRISWTGSGRTSPSRGPRSTWDVGRATSRAGSRSAACAR
jgi:uncharacterized protein YqgV (UPF0045/DUF77 family)